MEINIENSNTTKTKSKFQIQPNKAVASLFLSYRISGPLVSTSTARKLGGNSLACAVVAPPVANS